MELDASTNRKFGGTGLGLAITKQLVELMGGRIGVIRHPEGVEFWFTLRLSRQMNPVVSRPAPEVVSTLANARVLLVEDNEINQLVIQTLLARTEILIDVANDGEEALEMVKTKSYDLILMDIQMPKVDGYACTRLLRKGLIPASTPILAMTANATQKDMQQCLDAGMNDYIAKPISFPELTQALNHWLSRG